MLDAHCSVTAAAKPSEDVVALHDRCGIYTKPSMVEQILDAIGWTADVDLSASRLLEPAAGDGVFVLEAARRLLASFAHHLVPLSQETLAPRIRAFELHSTEAEIGRSGLAEIISTAGVERRVALEIVGEWLRTGDFLLTPLEQRSFTHAAGNPPYARWAKIPKSLRLAYEAELPKRIARGDLFLPFLDRSIDALEPTGRLGFLCSNRWQFMAFAEDFRKSRLPEVRIIKNDVVVADEVYQRSVDIYPSVLVLERRERALEAPALKRQGTTLKEAGFQVRVGPALGCTDAYVVAPEHIDQIEGELLAPWIEAADVREQEIERSGKHVICLYDHDGRLRNLQDFPRAFCWLSGFKERLEKRSIVAKHGAPWYRSIDRVYALPWAVPKILIPELSKTPRMALDEQGGVPAHGLYAIMPLREDADLPALYDQLRDGGLARAVAGHAPKVKGEYVRCYKSILEEIRI